MNMLLILSDILKEVIVLSIFNIRSQSKKENGGRCEHKYKANHDKVLPLPLESILKPVAAEESNDHSDIKTNRPEISEKFIVLLLDLIVFVVNLFVQFYHYH